MSVRLSVCPSGLGGNVIFSVPGLVSSSFATYGCCHPCLFLNTNFTATNSVVSAHVSYCYSEMSASKTCKLNFVQR